jgi:hypothetical protein
VTFDRSRTDADGAILSGERGSFTTILISTSVPGLMTTVELVRSARHSVERLFDALVDPARRERTMLLLLGGYLAMWSLYAAIAKSAENLHFDMGEMVAWSREISLGTPKHPPLGAWLVRGWFDVFPREDWAYYLLAITLPTVALWVVWRLSARYLPADKRVVGVALLTLVPFYNFLALKFNANTVLTPLWAATTWFFLCSFETRRAGWAVLAGIAAAAAMLGKYWSFVLLIGLGVAALTDVRRAAYFRSKAPFMTIAVGTILLTPHVAWIVTHNFEPFSYAINAHPATLLSAALSALRFTASIFAYLAIPIFLSFIAAQWPAKAIADTLWPREPERRILIVAFSSPFIVAVLVAVLLQIEISSLWTISAMTLFPIVLLSSPLVQIPRPAAVNLLGLAILVPIVMVAISPLVAFAISLEGTPNADQAYYRLIARAVERTWGDNTNQPLRIIGGDGAIVNGSLFYFTGFPSTYIIDDPALTPWADETRIKREGIAIVCSEEYNRCINPANEFASHFPSAKTEEVTLVRDHFGAVDSPMRYQIVIIPPQLP